MHLSRSEKSKAKKKARKQRSGQVWLILNLCLIMMIAALLIYYFKFKQHDPAGGTAYPDQAGIGMEGGREADPGSGKGAGSGSFDTGELEDPDLEIPVAEIEEVRDSGEEERVVLHFAGDSLFSGKVENALKQHGYDYPYRHLGTAFLDDDLTVLNLETPVTTRGVAAANKQFVFKSSPDVLPALRAAGVEAVNLANNHILDQGQEGLLDTLKHLDDHEIRYVGAGRNEKEAFAAQYFELKGMTVALLGFSRVLPETTWYALENRPGVAGAYDHVLPKAVEAIAAARQKADLVIVIPHWGQELHKTPDANQINLSRAFIEAGADLIIGGHPHVLQGLEQYKGKWIAYSTGNFIFTKSSNADTWKTAVFQASCNKQGACDIKLTPYRTEIGQVIPLEGKEAEAVLKEVQSRSIGGVTVTSQGEVIPGTAKEI
ncbi:MULTISPECIES: CapA family protein [Paenibacillus]|uniref:CapA family protein n=1 Tax=Paenibacillus TaxID=44249 RepID=UPI00048FC7B7|nr:CapA family protein [Paenibacillus sp. IHBB 10380]